MSNMEYAEAIVIQRWGSRPKKRREKKIGFFLRAHFPGQLWTLKDLSETQLAEFVTFMERRVQGLHCCEKHPCKRTH